MHSMPSGHRGSIRRAADVPGAWANRLVAAAFFLPCLAVLAIAAWLDLPGQGMHSLGLPPCGFKLATGLPCATCGMTTAFTYAAHGQFISSFLTQPAGALLALLTAMLLIVSGYATVTGISLSPLGRTLWRWQVVAALIALILAGWAYTLGITLFP